jgi:hypothetical protein
MDSESISPWQGALATQRCGPPAEHDVIIIIRSLQKWLERCQVNQSTEKEKIMNDITIMAMVETPSGKK